MAILTRSILPLALAILVLDRLSKWYVVDVLDLANRPYATIDVWPPVLRLVMAWNTGVNFGLGSGLSRWLLVALALAISAVLVGWAIRKGSRAVGLGVGLVVGGALGNAWDRASEWRAVADFLNVGCCGIENPFSFNAADIAIFLGAVWIALRA